MTTDDHAMLIDYLTEEGFTWPEIENVIAKLEAHDRKVHRESVFDSIESGSFDIQAIIKEARNGS